METLMIIGSLSGPHFSSMTYQKNDRLAYEFLNKMWSLVHTIDLSGQLR